ncbi:hypothetical protein Q5752_003548 [Cryptotrichosporon argae]
MTETVAFLYPGAMGAGLAKLLHARRPSLRLITSVGARSPASTARAAAAGLVDVPFPALVHEADVILSILPPSAAVELARAVAAELAAAPRARPPVFVDANAIAPTTAAEIAAIFAAADSGGAPVPFLDGCVIGFPPNERAEPKLYLSSAPAFEPALGEVARVLGGGPACGGLDVRVMPGAGEGAASALKMCYSGINKGATGLSTLVILAAQAHSPATADALLAELASSKPALLGGLTRSLPDMVGKAYRWVGEMEEIASFIASSLGVPAAGSVADTYDGLARVFQRVADDVRAAEAAAATGAVHTGDVDALQAWAAKGQARLAETDKP